MLASSIFLCLRAAVNNEAVVNIVPEGGVQVVADCLEQDVHRGRCTDLYQQEGRRTVGVDLVVVVTDDLDERDVGLRDGGTV